MEQTFFDPASQPFAPLQDVPADIPHGDMPGDKVHIGPEHIAKANAVLPRLLPLLREALAASAHGRAVVTVCGGSGVGKSELASLLSSALAQRGVGSYTLSGDNYPRRIPQYNDAERVRVFRTGGVRGLIAHGAYSAETAAQLRALWADESDPDPALTAQHPWLAVYQSEGRKALKGYLGTPAEQDFAELGDIVTQFQNGAERLWLKRMGRTDTELWYDSVDFAAVRVLVIEWTHGNSDWYPGADIPVFLNSTPQETAAYRRLRSRDGKTDSPFTTMVLQLEQLLLDAQAHKAKLIVSKSGEILSYAEYRALMARQ